MLSRQRLLLSLPLAAALIAIGCGGHYQASSSTTGTTGVTGGTDTTGGSGSTTGAGTIDLTITKNGSNAAFTTLQGNNSGNPPTFTLSDTNRNGNGATTLQAVKFQGSGGDSISFAVSFSHSTALAVGTTATLDNNSGDNTGGAQYTEITNLGGTTKGWESTGGTVKITALTATTATLEFTGVTLVPSDGTAATGSPTVAGTANGTFQSG